MYPRGLKTSLVVNLLVVSAAAMLLVDLVMISSARQELLKARLDTGSSLLAAIGPALLAEPGRKRLPVPQLAATLMEASANCIQVVDDAGKVVYKAGTACESMEPLNRGGLQAIGDGKINASFNGLTRGVLWTDKKNLVVSRPFSENGKTVGAGSIELSLDEVYEALRRSHRAFLVYLPVNLLFLVLFGFFRLYRSLLRPVNLLVNTAEEFRDDEEFAFFSEARDGEFNRLSHSLNKMLARINRDRTRLQETIGDLEAANLKLRKTQQEMVRAEKLASVGRLSAGIAHEIGNPIGIVIGYLDLLKQEGIGDEQKRDFINRAESEVSRVNTIIRQLLDFARQPVDEQQVGIAVHEVMKEVVEICMVQPFMAGISLETETAARQDFVMTTTGQLKQVFLNLLINAADAINSRPRDSEAGRVLIRTFNLEADADRSLGVASLQIDFIDNGPGIEAKDIENIFDPFYTTKEPGKGTGLGLSICFTIVENIGGTIMAASEGEGTIITLLLPLSSKPNASEETA